MPNLMVGLDPGVNTGFAVWDRAKRRLTVVESLKLHEAMEHVRLMHVGGSLHSVTFEDARKREWFGARMSPEMERAKLQGVGSVKRDCAIWEDYLRALGVPYVAQAPGVGLTKWNADTFVRITKWAGRTNSHGRDAALLVFGK